MCDNNYSFDSNSKTCQQSSIKVNSLCPDFYSNIYCGEGKFYNKDESKCDCKFYSSIKINSLHGKL